RKEEKNMDITIRGKASCVNCKENYDGKLIVHLQEDVDGKLKTVPPLEENELHSDEIAIHYDYGEVKDAIEGTFVCPACQTTNDVRIEIPQELLHNN
ncbi:hypothetical protein, partial [Enterococcus sp.]